MRKLIIIVAMLIMVGICIHGINRFVTPPSLRTSAIEEDYQDQISRLREIAYDHKNRWNVSPQLCDADRILFGLGEIIHASVQPKGGTYHIVGDRYFDKKLEFSWISSPFRLPGVVRQWLTLSDGKEISAVTFTDSVKDIDDRDVFIHLTVKFDEFQSGSGGSIAAVQGGSR